MRRVTVPSDPVAVIGSGSSVLIGELLDDGYTAITAVDIAQSALDQLRVGLGDRADRVTMVRADARTVRLASEVSLWHDRAVFHFFTNPQDQATYAATVARSVKVGGHLVLAQFAPDGPTSCSGLTVARHSAESLNSVFGHSFQMVGWLEADHVTPSGAVQRFIHALMRRGEILPSATIPPGPRR